MPVAAQLKSRIAEILRPDEIVSWMGAPTPRSFRSLAIAHMIFGLIPFSFGSLFLSLWARRILAHGIAGAALPLSLIGVVPAVLFVCLGICCFISCWMMPSRLREVVYALTDQRAIVVTSDKMFWNPIPALRTDEVLSEFSPAEVRAYKRTWQDFGRTDIVFIKRWQKTRRGGEWYYYGFLGIEDCDEVEKTIKQYFSREESVEKTT